MKLNGYFDGNYLLMLRAFFYRQRKLNLFATIFCYFLQFYLIHSNSVDFLFWICCSNSQFHCIEFTHDLQHILIFHPSRRIRNCQANFIQQIYPKHVKRCGCAAFSMQCSWASVLLRYALFDLQLLNSDFFLSSFVTPDIAWLKCGFNADTCVRCCAKKRLHDEFRQT